MQELWLIQYVPASVLPPTLEYIVLRCVSAQDGVKLQLVAPPRLVPRALRLQRAPGQLLHARRPCTRAPTCAPLVHNTQVALCRRPARCTGRMWTNKIHHFMTERELHRHGHAPQDEECACLRLPPLAWEAGCESPPGQQRTSLSKIELGSVPNCVCCMRQAFLSPPASADLT